MSEVGTGEMYGGTRNWVQQVVPSHRLVAHGNGCRLSVTWIWRIVLVLPPRICVYCIMLLISNTDVFSSWSDYVILFVNVFVLFFNHLFEQNSFNLIFIATYHNFRGYSCMHYIYSHVVTKNCIAHSWVNGVINECDCNCKTRSRLVLPGIR